MHSASTLRRRDLIAAASSGLLLLGAAPLAVARQREEDREPSPPRRRERGRERNADDDQPPRNRRPERGERDRGLPDGQPEPMAAPEGARLVRPPVLPNRWYLGVYAYDTEHGVAITDVVPDSPAARAGLEPRDVIVTVEGYQVGVVNDNYYPLGDELQNRAGRNGHVQMLVQNWRNDQLVNLDVRLERRGSYWRRERER